MGKYPDSTIHAQYSDWHWALVKKDEKYKYLYACDLDRLWIEYSFTRKAVIAIIDIKWENSGDKISSTEKGVYEWLERSGAKVFIVYITRDFSVFRVVNSEGVEYKLSPDGYASWLLDMRKNLYEIDPKYLIKEEPAQLEIEW